MSDILASVADRAGDYGCAVHKLERSDRWVCEFPDLPGCVAFGATRVEALQFGEQSLDLWLSKARELSIPIPVPGSASEASGQIKLRVPRSVHKRLVNAAAAIGISLNELVVQLLFLALSRLLSGVAEGKPATSFRLACLVPDRLQDVLPNPGREFSGSWIQRMPRHQHAQLQALAAREGTSLNNLANSLVAGELAALEVLILDVRSGTIRTAA